MNKFNPFESLLTFMKRDFTTFDMSNFHQTSCKLGRLNVNRVDSVLPSDYWKGSTSLAIKVAPLIAPAFTRIKALVNSFYVSYPQIWNYWNQFISNRPSDSYLSSVNSSKYNGRYIEPFIPFQFVALIAKIVTGYVQLAETSLGSGTKQIYFSPKNIDSSRIYVWDLTIVGGLRKWTCSLGSSASGTYTRNPDGYFGFSDNAMILCGQYMTNSRKTLCTNGKKNLNRRKIHC